LNADQRSVLDVLIKAGSEVNDLKDCSIPLTSLCVRNMRINFPLLGFLLEKGAAPQLRALFTPEVTHQANLISNKAIIDIFLIELLFLFNNDQRYNSFNWNKLNELKLESVENKENANWSHEHLALKEICLTNAVKLTKREIQQYQQLKTESLFDLIKEAKYEELIERLHEKEAYNNWLKTARNFLSRLKEFGDIKKYDSLASELIELDSFKINEVFNQEGFSLLTYATHIAVSNHNPTSIQIIALLLDYSFKLVGKGIYVKYIDQKDMNGRTALTYCFNSKNRMRLSIANILLHNQVDTNIKCDGYTVLQKAIENFDIEAVQLLIKHRADPYLKFTTPEGKKDAFGLVAMLKSSNNPDQAENIEEIEKTISSVKPHPVVTIINPPTRYTPPIQYYYNKLLPLIKSEIVAGRPGALADNLKEYRNLKIDKAKENIGLIVDLSEETFLITAVKRACRSEYGSTDRDNRIKVLEALLSTDIIVNKTNKHGRHPLTECRSVRGIDIEVMEILLDSGADANIKDGFHSTMLENAVKDRNYNATRILLKYPHSEESLKSAKLIAEKLRRNEFLDLIEKAIDKPEKSFVKSLDEGKQSSIDNCLHL
jgi:ankyrin repeat protein